MASGYQKIFRGKKQDYNVSVVLSDDGHGRLVKKYLVKFAEQSHPTTFYNLPTLMMEIIKREDNFRQVLDAYPVVEDIVDYCNDIVDNAT